MVYEIVLLLWLLEGRGDGGFDSEGVHVLLKIQSFRIVVVNLVDVRCGFVFGHFEIAVFFRVEVLDFLRVS